MSTKEQVKSGKLTPKEAMALVSPDSHTYGWCKRRASKGVVAQVTATEEEAPKKKKYRHKK